MCRQSTAGYIRALACLSLLAGATFVEAQRAAAQVDSSLFRRLHILEPPELARILTITGTTSDWSVQPPAGGLSASVAHANDGAGGHRACMPIANAPEMAGRFALVERGGCNFSLKAYHAQQAGAIGFVVYYDGATPCEPPGYVFMAAGDSAHAVRIPGGYIPCGYFLPACSSYSCGMAEALESGQTVTVRMLPVGPVYTGLPHPVDGTVFLSQAMPNPSSETATVHLRLPAPERTRVELVDLLGRRVVLLHDGPLGAGDLHPFVVQSGSVPAGLYLFRVTGETFVEVRRVTFVR